MIATAGKDKYIRVYDEATKSCVVELCGGWGKEAPGHSNRIFSVKYSRSEPNLLVSAGWDNTIQVWDVAAGSPVRSMYGAHICGDAVDLRGSEVLTGSWRPNNQLQVWDLETGKLKEEIPLST